MGKVGKWVLQCTVVGRWKVWQSEQVGTQDMGYWWGDIQPGLGRVGRQRRLGEAGRLGRAGYRLHRAWACNLWKEEKKTSSKLMGQ